MIQPRQLGWRATIVLLASLAFAGAWAAGEVRSIRDRSEVAKMMEKMKTVCVGRHLIDVPTQAPLSLSHQMISGFTIDTVEETEPEFHARLAAREADIVAGGIGAGGSGEGGMVDARDLHIAGLVGRSFIYGRSRGYLMAGDRRIYMESVSVEVHAHIDGLSFSLAAARTEEASAKEAGALFARLRLRAPNEIPTVSGFCIDRAIFADPLPPHTNEHIAMTLGLPGHPDLYVMFMSLAGVKPSPGLLARVADTDAAASADEIPRVSKLRAGRRRINGIDGEQVLERVRELNFTTGYGFNWEAPGTEDDLGRPFLSLELETGNSERPGGEPVDTSLREDALLDLWDRISSSIRLRSVTAPDKHPPPRKAAVSNRDPAPT